MEKKLKYTFGEFTIYSNYIVAVMKEGVTISNEKYNAIVDITKKYYGDSKPFVYVTHRKNSYAINPKVYLETSKIDNLLGFAVVTGEKIMIDNSDIEKLFLQKPFEIFSTLEDAYKWANKLCKNKSDESLT
ncbi:hypothetical protein GCM10022271_22480 [Corallibacter vietnamensis]|uniref:STAS/SEC14 domain-containing protein n=1 Tax=Corallibacter vietnamensis TaxID=904130 RepID=A0ABP7HA97_9FLAO